MTEKDELDEITKRVIGAAISVHRALGPGLLESAYQSCLAAEMEAIGLRFEREVELPVLYRGREVDCGYRLDFVVEGKVVIEVKSIEAFEAIHIAQLLSYLRLSRRKVGLLINFNSVVLKSGIKRVVNNYPELRALSASAVSKA